MRIIEIFHSLQGEGPLTGVRTSFVRTARCNLRCAWCDTTYSFGAGEEQSLESIVRKVRSHRTRNVCLTGGEPLLQGESVELVRRLSKAGYTTVIETGGSLDVTPYLDIEGVVLSVDVKCPSSRMESHNRWANLPRLRPTDVVKFVLADGRDYTYAKRTLKSHRTRAQIVFQPVWGTNAGSLADRVVKDKLDVRFLLQEHKVLWGDVPGR
ncbi:MAG: radical SAM protein [Thermoplasmata archaeon]|nr:radical SAM protein [Thermoplasmata archaeon]